MWCDIFIRISDVQLLVLMCLSEQQSSLALLQYSLPEDHVLWMYCTATQGHQTPPQTYVVCSADMGPIT